MRVAGIFNVLWRAAMEKLDAYKPSPRCPRCDHSMRVLPAANEIERTPGLQIFECDPCSLKIGWVVEADAREMAAA